ncbi:S66 peptidase family protein [Methanococcus vannielii]|uniref:hypothetical protein n=1 Tax=Methanococcus vannielii TaxID=2187 RepID=UPI00064E62EB|nr:hypothetical protein [Methanococcus vannielii]
MDIDFKKSFENCILSENALKIIKEYGINPKKIAIGEFAGRDSAAAIIKAFENPEIDAILPILAFTGTDYGEREIYYKNWNLINERIGELYEKKYLLPLHFIFEPKLWNALNGRFVAAIIKKYGYYSPCIGCHAYLRVIRIPIAKHFGNKIITGERILHDNDFKIDQLKETLEIYHEICEKFGVELLFPVKNIEKGVEIKEIIGKNWEQGKNQYSCMFSGNYRDSDGKVIFEKEKILEILTKFIYPASIEILRNGYSKNFNYIETVKKYI